MSGDATWIMGIFHLCLVMRIRFLSEQLENGNPKPRPIRFKLSYLSIYTEHMPKHRQTALRQLNYLQANGFLELNGKFWCVTKKFTRILDEVIHECVTTGADPYPKRAVIDQEMLDMTIPMLR